MNKVCIGSRMLTFPTGGEKAKNDATRIVSTLNGYRLLSLSCRGEDIHISIDLNTDTKYQPEEDEEDKDDKYLFYSPLFGFIGGSKKLDRRILKIAIAVFIGPWVVAAIFFLGLFLV